MLTERQIVNMGILIKLKNSPLGGRVVFPKKGLVAFQDYNSLIFYGLAEIHNDGQYDICRITDRGLEYAKNVKVPCFLIEFSSSESFVAHTVEDLIADIEADKIEGELYKALRGDYSPGKPVFSVVYIEKTIYELSMENDNG